MVLDRLVGMARWLVATATGAANYSTADNFSQVHSYRESVQSIAVGGGHLAIQMLPPSGDSDSCGTTSGNSQMCLSSSSSGWASAAAGLQARCAAAELNKIAHKMVQDGYIERQIQAFIQSTPTVGGPYHVLQEWGSQLDVDWVLRINQQEEGMQLGKQLQGSTESWTRGLALIVRILCITDPDAIWGKASMASHPDLQQTALQLARLAEASILKMLDFPDTIQSLNNLAVTGKLPSMVYVYTCIATAEPEIKLLQLGSSSSQVKTMYGNIHQLLSHQMYKLGEGIWCTMEEIKSCFMTDVSWEIPRDTEIHNATGFMMDYVKFLWDNVSSVNQIVNTKDVTLHDTTWEILTCLRSLLEKKAQMLSCPFPGLRFIFLLNNSNYISHKLKSLNPSYCDMWSLYTHQYINSYITDSWTPLLPFLSHATPLCSMRYSSLHIFFSEFDKVYAAQKLWKVHSPELRETLRKSIVHHIIPAYKNYLEEHSVQSLSHNPLYLENMLKEMFEG